MSLLEYRGYTIAITKYATICKIYLNDYVAFSNTNFDSLYFAMQAIDNRIECGI